MRAGTGESTRTEDEDVRPWGGEESLGTGREGRRDAKEKRRNRWGVGPRGVSFTLHVGLPLI